jgi:phage terminase large subunit
MSTLQIELPPKLIPLFAVERGGLRYRGSHGGRGSGKSFTFAKMAAVFGAIEPLRILCTREYMNSIRESFHAEVKNAIESCRWLSSVYDVGEHFVRGRAGTSATGTEFIFKGLRHNIASVKSMAQIDICIVEEAEDIPMSSWIDLEPTIRAPKSEIWVIWNPKSAESAVHQLLIANTPPRAMIVEMNYRDNPWFPAELEEQRQHAQNTMNPDLYAHVWEGACLERSESQIFSDKYTIAEFQPTREWGQPFCGLDFGFAQDPTAAVKCWVYDRRLYIEHEAGKVRLELDATAEYVGSRIPEFRHNEVQADSARPESINYLQRHGLPKIVGVDKWKGSVEDGIVFMQSFDGIVIHPRCVETAKEFRLYSYMVDKAGRVTNDIADAYNHYIDAIRYALSRMIKRKKSGWTSI